MQVENGKVVSFHYRLKDANDNLLEESHGGDPTVYLHGKKNILPALEAEFAGKQAGDSIQVSLTPEQAYGEYNPDAVQRVPLKRILGKQNKNAKLSVRQSLRASKPATRYRLVWHPSRPMANTTLTRFSVFR